MKLFQCVFNVAQTKDVGVCQKNCAIDYSKCLITTFDMATCSKQEAGCALDCLKSTVEVTQTAKCSICKAGIGAIEQLIASKGCNVAGPALDAACAGIFAGPEDPATILCITGVIKYCPTILKWIEGKMYSPTKACTQLKIC